MKIDSGAEVSLLASTIAKKITNSNQRRRDAKVQSHRPGRKIKIEGKATILVTMNEKEEITAAYVTPELELKDIIISFGYGFGNSFPMKF